ncbi:hypothetical protein [Aliagarivorans marinus]|uniref:hypothetical protein n=1 Tax=Aliagarivorans marinus TaxID=561965 RepID=UPI0003FF06BE|nr:hypothetical protein [Aliagarivorans marinus]
MSQDFIGQVLPPKPAVPTRKERPIKTGEVYKKTAAEGQADVKTRVKPKGEQQKRKKPKDDGHDIDVFV